MSNFLSAEESFIQASPPYDQHFVEDLPTHTQPDNVIALGVQQLLLPVLRNPTHIPALTQERTVAINRVRAACFAGFVPRPQDLDALESLGDTDILQQPLAQAMLSTRALIEHENTRRTALYELLGSGRLSRAVRDKEAAAAFAKAFAGGVLFFGSARRGPESEDYDAARWVAQCIVAGLPLPDGRTERIIQGTGSGVMEGAAEGGQRGAWLHVQRLIRAQRNEDLARFLTENITTLGSRISLNVGMGWHKYQEVNLMMNEFAERALSLVDACTGFDGDRDFDNAQSIDHKGRHPAVFNFNPGFGTMYENAEVIQRLQYTAYGKGMPEVPIFLVGSATTSIYRTVQQQLDPRTGMGTIDNEFEPERRLIYFCSDEVDLLRKYLEHYHLEPSEWLREEINHRTLTLGNGRERTKSMLVREIKA